MNKSLFLSFLLLSCAARHSFAQAGLPDSTFGTDGQTITIADTPSSKNQAYSIAVQPDNKLVVAGWVGNPINAKFALARYSSEGILDLSFGNNGIVKSSVVANGISYNNAVMILPNGKIVVVGNGRDVHNKSNYDFAILQYNENGTPDSAFGSAGKILTSINDLDYATCLAAQPDGKIVVGGYSWNGTNDDFAVVRYGPDGKLDGTFGTQGKVTTNILYRDYGASIAVQPDGKIVLAGSAANNTNSIMEFAVVRYNADGSRDNTFGTNGIVTAMPALYNNLCEGMAIQPDGKILLSGWCDRGTGALLYAVVRLNSSGTPDNTFGIAGKAITQSGTNGGANAITLQADGKIIVSGNAILRYNADGSVDSSFDTTGITNLAFTSHAIAVQRNGKIVVAGSALINSHHSFVVARFLSGLNYVTTGLVSDRICAGSTVRVPFTVIGDFNADNIFTVQLSDSTGSFENFVILGSVQATGSVTMNVIIPENTPYGTHFRIQVVSSQPGAYFYDNGIDLLISPVPVGTILQNNNTLSTEIFTSYQWTLNDVLIANANSQQYTFTQTGSYSVIVANASGCADTSDPVTIVDTIMTGTVNSPICAGSILTVPFSAQYFFTGGNTFTAQLSDANGDFSNPISIGTIQATAGDTIQAVIKSDVPGGAGYRVRVVSNTPGIIGSAEATDITINPVPQPGIAPSGDTLLTGNFSSYQWQRNDTIIAGATAQRYVTLQPGLYSVVVTDANGCTGISAQHQVGTTGIKFLADNSQVGIFPNPTTGKINVQWAGSLASPVEIRIFDSYGKLVIEQTENSGLSSFDFNLKGLPSGIYYLNVRSGEPNAGKIIVLTK